MFISPSKVQWSPIKHLSYSINLGEDELEDEDAYLQFGTHNNYRCDNNIDNHNDDDPNNFDLKRSHLEMNAHDIEVFVITPQARLTMIKFGILKPI